MSIATKTDPSPGCSTPRSRGNLALLWLAATFPTGAALIYFVLLLDHPGAPVAYAASKVVQFLLPAAALYSVLAARRRQRALEAVTPRGTTVGDDSRPGAAGPPMLAGLAAGILLSTGALVTRLLLSADPALGDLAGAVALRIASYSLSEPARYVAFALFLSLAHSALEEYYWRWFLLGGLIQRGIAKSRAILVSSLAFTAHHVVVVAGYVPRDRWPLVVLGSAGVLVAGLVWSWLFLRWRSVRSPWVSHVLVDLTVLALGWELVGRASALEP
jgi:membrane protease YdiL (CAAX protease family)